MKLEVLKDLPDGTKPGTVIDVNEAIGDVLVLVGGAKKIEEHQPARTGARRTYQRRDLEAETDAS